MQKSLWFWPKLRGIFRYVSPYFIKKLKLPWYPQLKRLKSEKKKMTMVSLIIKFEFGQNFEKTMVSLTP